MTETPDTAPEDAYDYGELLIVQHASHTGPAGLTQVLDARADQRPWRLVDLGADAPFPGLDEARGILVLGGPMGVTDTDEHPWLSEEIAVLRDARDRGIPVFGICLGAQLLGDALGGTVAPRDVPEIGFLPLMRTEAAQDDPVFAGWADGSAAAFLHADEVVQLPDGAEPMLAGSDGVPAWRAADGRSYAVQFHPEVDAAQLAVWADRDSNRDRFEAAGVDPDAFAAEAQRRDAHLRAAGLSLVGRWLDQVIGADDPDPKRGRRARG
ncbi:MAG: type 1 glutamine amidotransferase [Actinobacteria bacterium]|nr:type 1 glutamine amidotransferase [Actinomycetota bacterium]